jgi:tight adherence protein B
MALLAALLVGLTAYLVVALLLGATPRAGQRSRTRLRVHLQARQRWLLQGGSNLTVRQFYAGSAAAGVAVAVVLLALTGSAVSAVLLGALAAAAPAVYFSRHRQARIREVQQAWPDGLRELLSWVSIGFSIPEGLSLVARQGPPPLQRALAQLPARLRYYDELTALELTREELADPTADRVFEVLVLGTEHGGGETVVRVLEELVEHTSEDLRVLDEVKSNTLSSKISARVLFAIPWLTVAVLCLVQAPYRVFYQHSTGLVVLFAGAVMSTFGMWWVMRLGRVPQERRVFGAAAAEFASMPAVLPFAPMLTEGRQPGSLLAALAVGLAVYLLARAVVPQTPRLARRVRPYAAASRTRLGHTPDVLAITGRGVAVEGGTVRQLYGPALLRVAARIGSLAGPAADQRTLLRLQQVGRYADIPEEQRLARYRFDLLQSALLVAFGGLVLGAVFGSALLALGAAGFFFAFRLTQYRAGIDREIRRRCEAMRIEIYTVNQLLATYLRVSDGPAQAIGRLVRRGRGTVVQELAEVLRLHQSGQPLAVALRSVARRTPEPHVARTLNALAAGAEHGADLARALLELSKDVRTQRREDLRRAAVRREAQTMVPTTLVMAPVFVLFVLAPMPSLLFGQIGI